MASNSYLNQAARYLDQAASYLDLAAIASKRRDRKACEEYLELAARFERLAAVGQGLLPADLSGDQGQQP